ncbi:hypothetical protein [Tunturiibacter gelidiferens]|uniref:hypothetical protein n=1 Tax=Tunturiibacter gelidiferens TaxID=3069689 RepID=UPI00334133C6
MDSGSFVFSRAQTAGTATTTANSGDGFASFLLGQVAQATVKQNFVTIRNVGQYSALYVQDEFKANKDLNLSLGLRYDVDLPFKELHNFGSQFNPTTINTGAQGTNTPGALEFAGNGAGKDGISSRYSNVYYKNVEPRVGITWSPSSLGHKSVFSAAYSGLNAPILQWQQIYGGVPAGYSSISQINNNANPFTTGELLDPASLKSPGIANPGAFGVPNIPTNPSFDRSQLNGQNVNYTRRDFGKPGYDQTWTATVQQQFATDLILTLAISVSGPFTSAPTCSTSTIFRSRTSPSAPSSAIPSRAPARRSTESPLLTLAFREPSHKLSDPSLNITWLTPMPMAKTTASFPTTR